MAPEVVDAVVVGGGLVGAAVARDLALRGLGVLLLEREDWGVGAAGEVELSGPRLLSRSADVGAMALVEARVLASISHLVRPLRFLVLRAEDDAGWEDRMERLHRLWPGGAARLSPVQALRLEPGLGSRVVEAAIVDGLTTDPPRLVWTTVLDACRAGAVAANHSPVEALLRKAGAVVGVRYRAPDGRRLETRCRAVVNAAGAWAPAVAEMAGCRLEVRTVRRAWVALGESVSEGGVAAPTSDGRLVGLVPGPTGTLVGPLEDHWFGAPDGVELLAREAAELRHTVARVIPGAARAPALTAVAAARATPPSWGAPDRAADVLVVDHAAEGAAGLVSVIGADPALHRLAAERAADTVCCRLEIRVGSVTAHRPLPGAGPADPALLAREHGLPPPVAERLVRRRGAEAADVLDGRSALVCHCLGITEAELAFSAQKEQVRTLDDADRRLGLGSGPCSAICLERSAEIVGRELGWSPAQRRRACRERLARVWPLTAPVLDSWGWARQELSLGLRRGWPWGRLAPRRRTR